MFKKKLIIIFIIVSLSCCFISCSKLPDKHLIHGATMGMTLEDIAKLENNEGFFYETGYILQNTNVYDQSCDLVYYFHENTLHTITVSFYNNDFSTFKRLQQSLISDYGSPSKTEDLMESTTTFPLLKYSWEAKNASINLMYMPISKYNTEESVTIVVSQNSDNSNNLE